MQSLNVPAQRCTVCVVAHTRQCCSISALTFPRDPTLIYHLDYLDSSSSNLAEEIGGKKSYFMF